MRLTAIGAVAIASSCLFPMAVTAAGPAGEQKPVRTRDFRFEYGAKLQGLREGARVRVWLPVPQSSDHQRISEHLSELPGEAQTGIEPVYGNKVRYFEATASDDQPLSFRQVYTVHRREVRGLSSNGRRVELSQQQRKRFLSANAKVPLQGRQTELLNGLDSTNQPLSLARALYGRVDDHVRYDKSKPGYGNGDVLWVCDSQTGNCTDFHSLFISLARAKGLPARFEIGFPLPPRRGAGPIGGYHCWALFHTAEHGWVPVDISEADKHPELKEYYFGNLTEDRITFSTGRDIELVPRQAGDPLNYFVYPYVEVDGKPLKREQIELLFSYRDLKAPGRVDKPNRP